MEEEWKDIEDYEGLYQVSNFGRVKSLHSYGGNQERIMKPAKAQGPYYHVTLCKDGKHKMAMVHRLVAKAFIENPNEYEFVNHKDENKENNRVDNLEWCTKSYNAIYYLNFKPERKKEYGNRFRDKQTGEMLSPRTKPGPFKYKNKIAQKTKDGKIIKIYENANEAKKELGVNGGDIITVAKTKKKNGEPRTFRGYIWEFLD